MSICLTVLFLGLLSTPITHAEIYSFITRCNYSSLGPSYTDPIQAAIDSSGNIYTVEDSSRIIKFDSNGNIITQWNGPQVPSGEQVTTPMGITLESRYRSIAVDSSDNIYVADMSYNHILKFDSNGAYITQWGSEGTGDGQFQTPLGVAVDSSDNVYVADYENCRIQKFSSTGEYITQWSINNEDGNHQKISDIAIDSKDNVYVIGELGSNVEKFDSNGALITQIGSFGDTVGQYREPKSIAADSKGYVYITDNNDVIKMYDGEGNFVAQWGSQGYDDQIVNQFFGISNVVVDSSDYLYVLDVNGIKKFSINYDDLPTLPVSSAPVADFSSNVTKGDAPLTVQFTDDSQNAQVLSWSFGDGNMSPDQSPVHTYTTAGTYNVALTASNVKGNNTKIETIFVQQAVSSDSGNSQNSEVSNTPTTMETTETTETTSASDGESNKSPGFDVVPGIVGLSAMFLYKKR